MLRGGAGDDKIDAGLGDDRIEGGAGNDQLRGGGGFDVYVYGDDWGEDSFNDRDGNTGLDFSAMSQGATVSIAKRVVSVINAAGQELRVGQRPGWHLEDFGSLGGGGGGEQRERGERGSGAAEHGQSFGRRSSAGRSS